MQRNRLRATRRILRAVIRVITWVAAGALCLMVSIIFINVVGRYLLNRPLMGTVEIVQVVLVMTVFLSVAHTEVREAHIAFNEVVIRFSRRAQAIVMGIVSFVAAAYFIIMAWQEVVLSIGYIVPTISGTDVLHIPVFPFMYIIAIGAMLLGLELLLNGLFLLSPEDGRKTR